MGPSAIRIAHVAEQLEELGLEVVDGGNIPVPAPERRDVGDPNARYLEPVARVCNRLRLRTRKALDDGEVPLVLGGDHSIAAGTVSGVSEHFHHKGESIGLIWVDAHADMNTPGTSPSGNVHGMPLASLMGHGPEVLTEMGGFSPKVRPEHVCLIGIRDLDDGERKLIRETGVHAYTSRDIDERGMKAVIEESIQFATKGTAGYHVSFDLDGMDPKDVPGVGTPVKGGITWREANLLMEKVADSGHMVSLEVTELNPVLDVRNRSGEVAVDVILSAFGKRIL